MFAKLSLSEIHFLMTTNTHLNISDKLYPTFARKINQPTNREPFLKKGLLFIAHSSHLISRIPFYLSP